MLGNEHRDNYANGLISGQGTMECFWEYRYKDCDSFDNDGCELPHYYAQLLLRLKQGSSFEGRFFVYVGNNEEGAPSVWYDAACVVTNVSLAFAPGQPITSSIQFVTTGPVNFMGYLSGFVLQEDFDKILQENEGGILLEEPD